jgi:hypothetical protein
MNAISRKKDEATVLSSEAIEVHLQYLRSGLDRLENRFEKTDARFEKADARLDTLTHDLAEVRGYQKALFWVLSLAGTGAAALSIARTFGWV